MFQKHVKKLSVYSYAKPFLLKSYITMQHFDITCLPKRVLIQKPYLTMTTFKLTVIIYAVSIYPMLCKHPAKCPGGHPILHQGLKLNSKISVEKYIKKLDSPGPINFPLGS